MRYRCLLCGLPDLATDACVRRTRGELGALRQHAMQEHDLAPAALDGATRETQSDGRVLWRLPDGRAWAEGSPAGVPR